MKPFHTINLSPTGSDALAAVGETVDALVKKDDLVSIDIFKPPVIRTTFWALKLDLADLKEHVGIQRKNGFFKQLRFTPENPEEFVSKNREILNISY